MTAIFNFDNEKQREVHQTIRDCDVIILPKLMQHAISSHFGGLPLALDFFVEDFGRIYRGPSPNFRPCHDGSSVPTRKSRRHL